MGLNVVSSNYSAEIAVQLAIAERCRTVMMDSQQKGSTIEYVDINVQSRISARDGSQETRFGMRQVILLGIEHGLVNALAAVEECGAMS